MPEKEKTRATQRKMTHRLATTTSGIGGTDGDTNSHNHRDLEEREKGEAEREGIRVREEEKGASSSVAGGSRSGSPESERTNASRGDRDA